MKGKHIVKVADNRVRYQFELVRNITIVQGNSGTGKTTLFEMIAAYARLHEKSGVRLTCDKPCISLRPDSDWENILSNISDSIVFIDEDADYVSSRQFSAVMKASDNYYVFFSREPLYNLPYSAEEIYEIKTSGKYHTFKRRYTQSKKGCVYAKATNSQNSEVILTEDSHAGFCLYQNLYKDTQVECISAGNNSNIFNWLGEHHAKKTFVIADGAAFGAEMNRVMALQRQFADRITICLPESFKWLILKSGLIDIPGLKKILDNPSDFIESGQYLSWENFFTDCLVRNTSGTYYAYSKAHLNSYYVVKGNSKKIVELIASNMPESE